MPTMPFVRAGALIRVNAINPRLKIRTVSSPFLEQFTSHRAACADASRFLAAHNGISDGRLFTRALIATPAAYCHQAGTCARKTCAGRILGTWPVDRNRGVRTAASSDRRPRARIPPAQVLRKKVL